MKVEAALEMGAEIVDYQFRWLFPIWQDCSRNKSVWGLP